jgi:putative two-component system response regulator
MTNEKPKITIVDDDPQIGHLLTKYLTKKNYVVTSFTSPKQALKHLENKPVDLMITDMNMPEMNGLEVIKAVKESNPKLPIILMSSEFPNTERMDEMIKLGVSDFISKPFELNCLESKIALKTQETNCLMNNLP